MRVVRIQYTLSIKPDGAESDLLDDSIDQYLGMSQRGSDPTRSCGSMLRQSVWFSFPWNAVKRGGTNNELRPPDLLGSIVEMGFRVKLELPCLGGGTTPVIKSTRGCGAW